MSVEIITADVTNTTRLERIFPGLGERVHLPCRCRGVHYTYVLPLKMIIPHLNDHHQWTREAIADWLEALDLDLQAKRLEG